MRHVGVYLGGEGSNELGTRAGHPVHQTDREPGVLQALLLRVQSEGWHVVGAREWKRIRKFRAKGPSPNEERNVLGLVDAAAAAGAEVVAFVRDADDDEERPRVIERALRKAEEYFPGVKVIGGAAVPVLEGWVLAMLGERSTEKLGRNAAQLKLQSKGIAAKSTAAMVDVVERASLDQLPVDARSLGRWVSSAKEILPPLVRDNSA